MQQYRPITPFTFFVAFALLMGDGGCSPSTSSAVPVGATSTGGTPATSNTSVCVEGQIYPRTSTFCSSDGDCPTDSSCSGVVQGSSYTCIHGILEPSSYILVRICESYPSVCTSAGSAIRSFLTDSNCTVMVRVSADTRTILGYAVNCGKPNGPTYSDVLGFLLKMNSINWTGATEMTDPRTTGLIVFTVVDGAASYTAFFSAATGNQLLITQAFDSDAGAGDLNRNVVWYDATDLGTSCVSGEGLSATDAGSNSSQTELEVAWSVINGTNLIPALRLNFGPVDSYYVTPVGVGLTEFLFFFNSHCDHC